VFVEIVSLSQATTIVSVNRLHQGPGFRRTALRENWANALDFKDLLYQESAQVAGS
jgi:hypothetical protein